MGAGGDDTAALNQLGRIISSVPVGGSNICGALSAIVEEIRAMLPVLERDGRCASIVLASDGEVYK